MTDKKLMLGNQAVARGAYEAGVTVASAYPGTPSTEIAENIVKYDGIHAEWAPNEKVALEVAVGASIAGARAIACMKHVGLNVAADALYTSSYIGVNGGLVVVVADDPGMHSSQNEQDTRRVAIAAKVPCLEPSDSEQCRTFTKAAFEISEKYDTPVILRLTTRISHSQSAVCEQPPERFQPIEYKKDVQKFVAMPAFARARHVIVEQNLNRLADDAASCEFDHLNQVQWGDKRVGVITSGIEYQYAKQVFDGASFLKLGLVYPLPEKLIRDFAAQVETLYVIEQLDPVIEEFCVNLGINVIGKSKLPICGEYSADLLQEALFDQCSQTFQVQHEMPVRPPVMCPGCPHRGVHFVLNKLKKVVMGDIGCYTLGALPPTQSMDACLCMGASVGMAHGFDMAHRSGATVNVADVVGIIGDSTFIHSGITGLINTVYNKGVSTLMILDNSITGMTGHQHHPATGKTLSGETTYAIDLELLCKAVGVNRVVTVDAYDVQNLEQTIQQETSAAEPSVIIVRQPCALLPEARQAKRGVTYNVDADKCTGCGACLKIGCPAMQRDATRKVVIDQNTCAGCGLCAKLCKFQAIGTCFANSTVGGNAQ